MSFLALASACRSDETSNRPSAEDCRELRDHIAALSVARAAGPRTSERIRAELDKHEQNVSRSLGDAFIERCQREYSLEYVACGLETESTTNLSKCEATQGASK